MGHKFERERMEPQDDGSVLIGIRIIGTAGPAGHDPDGVVDPDLGQSCQWVPCRQAHAHGWDVCDVRALFGARQQQQRVDAQGKPVVDGRGQAVMEDVPGSSARERLVAWLDQQRAQRGRPREIPLPTRKVTRDGKEVDEPIKGVSLT